VGARKDTDRALEDQLTLHQGLQGSGQVNAFAGQMRQGIIPEDAADYRGLLQAVALSQAQAVEAGLQEPARVPGTRT